MARLKCLTVLLATTLVLGAHASARAQPAAGKTETRAAVKLYTLDCGLTEFTESSVFSDTGEYDGKPIALPTPCYLVQHGNDWMLWDTGLGDQLATLKDGVSKFGGRFSVSKTLESQLAELRLTPDDIHYVGISHLHFDHAGNIGLFPKSTFIIPGSELAAARSKPTPFGVDPSQIEPLDHANVIPSEGDYDVFGDGTVITLKTPGHTPGHRSLLIKLSRSGYVLISGDLYHTKQNYQNSLVPRINDRPNTLASMDRFIKLKTNMNARLIIQHSPEDFASMPTLPKFLD